jgi:hypothetical protein
LQPVGFCLYAFFGIIGTLYCSSHKEQAKKYFPLISLVLVLFFVRYAFPIFGMRNIIPDRWPAFAFIVFALFIGLGIFCSIDLLQKKKMILCSVVIFFFIGSFMMITNASTNHDSPLYSEEMFFKLVWTESEMSMYTHINSTYDGTISADAQTAGRPFGIFLKNKNAVPYYFSSDGILDEKRLSDSLVVWRKESLTRPERVGSDRYGTSMLLGERFLRYLNSNYSCISHINTARCYL